jgi:anti-sigma regulatory factor (Ser/Thr protein kinase)
LPASLSIAVVSHEDSLGPTRQRATLFLAGHGLSQSVIDDACTILGELLANAIEHGTKGDGTEVVDVVLAVESDYIGIECCDPGTGKGPKSCLEVQIPDRVPLRALRGRGLMLTRRLASSLDRGLGPRGGAHVRALLRMAVP